MHIYGACMWMRMWMRMVQKAIEVQCGDLVEHFAPVFTDVPGFLLNFWPTQGLGMLHGLARALRRCKIFLAYIYSLLGYLMLMGKWKSYRNPVILGQH